MGKILSLRSEYQLYLFSGNITSLEHQDAYLKAYQCWKSVWEGVYQDEMKVSHPLYADDFLRQDRIVALFSGGHCAGVAFMRSSEMGLLPWQQDSFFRFWPETTKPEILSMSSKVSLATYFTLHPEFRKSVQDISWKDLLLGLFLDAFYESESDIMITAARKCRSNEKLCQKLGAKLIQENVPYLIDGHPIEGEIADLVYWPKVRTALKDESLETLRQRIWNNRIDDSKYKSRKGVRHAA